MPSRERWIVYPLLFLALGLAMRPSLVSTMEVQDIRCRSITSGKLKTGDANVQHLRVIDDEGRLHADLATTTGGGALNLIRYGGRITQGHTSIYARDRGNLGVEIGEVYMRPKLDPPLKAKADEWDDAAPRRVPAGKEAAANEK